MALDMVQYTGKGRQYHVFIWRNSMASRSKPSTKEINKHLNSTPKYPLKTGGASNGVGRIEKSKGK